MPPRRLALIVVSALALPLAALAPAATERQEPAVRQEVIATPPVFVLSGRGWGHGVGMSQWGAYGFALRDTTYDRILAHYYQGTTLGPAPVARVRVLLVAGKKALTISSEEPFRVKDATGRVRQLAAGPHTFGPGLRLKPKGAKRVRQLEGPLLFLPGRGRLTLERTYRGSIQVDVVDGTLRAINVVGLEPYLYGVVPSEVPTRWPAEVLKAQAVVARSYALATRKSGAFDLYADTRSQVYLGVTEEEQATTAAIDATASQVVLYRGRVATTYYHSTSGGRTASVEDAWPKSQPVPYLVSVPDPYDSLSPHHTWGPLVVPAVRLRKALRVPGRLLDVRTTLNASGRVGSLTATGSSGEVTVPGSTVRRALGLRSTWFRVGILALAEPAGLPVVYGSGIKLSGIARNLPKVTLERRPAGTAWEPGSPVTPARDGSFTLSVKPQVTTQYRLAAGKARTAAVRVPVAPLVRFYSARDALGLQGYARPILSGATAEVQRLEDGVWRTVAGAAIDSNGDFDARFRLVPGSYRARVAPGRGFVPGTSAVLQVTGA